MNNENNKRNKIILYVALVVAIVILGLMIWSMFLNRPKVVDETMGEGHGAGEEMSYDYFSYANSAILEDELDADVVSVVLTQVELALINNSELNIKQTRVYTVTFSEPSPALIDSETRSFFYDFGFSITGTEKGDVSYEAYVMVEGNLDPEINANDFVTTVLKAQQNNAYGDLVVTNSPNTERVDAFAKQYLSDPAVEVIQSGIY